MTGKHKLDDNSNTFLDISLKKGIGILNLCTLPYLSFFSTNLLGFFNTQMIFMLRDPEQFNVPEKKIGNMTS